MELKELSIYAGERFEMLVDGRDGRAFDIVTLPVAQDIMRLPPFDRPLPLVTIRPDGADGTGQLPSSLAVLPALPQQLPPVSQELVMNMFRDMQGMMPLEQAGLPAMIKSGNTDPAVVARVVKLIVGDPALSEAEQLSSSGVNGKPFSLNRVRFLGAPQPGSPLADLGTTRSNAAPRAHPWLPVPHHLPGWQAAGTRACGVEGCRTNLERRRCRNPGAVPVCGDPR